MIMEHKDGVTGTKRMVFGWVWPRVVCGLLTLGWGLAGGGCGKDTYDFRFDPQHDAGGLDGCFAMPEVCDSIDNDCDGLTDDEDPSLQANDVGNCGACGHVCDLDHVEVHKCEEGICGISKCEEGFSDINGIAADGCEAECVKTSEWDRCDGVDNDCNGITDDGFDLDADPNNCGSCGFRCSESYDASTYHALSFGCEGGQCVPATCRPDWWDLDGLLDDGQGNLGCEYHCVQQYGGMELCNGVDDDCDGVIDNDPTLAPPCLDKGVCASTQATCDATAGEWLCLYPAVSYQVEEDDSRPCDGVDNDCDGLTDEGWGVGGTCFVGEGACRRQGTWVCNAGGGVRCDAIAGSPSTEVCDGVDNDCDGQVDYVAPGDATGLADLGQFVFVDDGGGGFTMFAFEASRPNAAIDDAGFGEDWVPCSVAGVLPWSHVIAVDVEAPQEDTAAEICARIPGWRLCTRSEWEWACSAGAAEVFPYGDLYWPETCNGHDYGYGLNNDPADVHARPTGALSACVRIIGGAWGGSIFDLSGNLKELVSGGSTGFEARGGSYNVASFEQWIEGQAVTVAPGLRCAAGSPMPSDSEVKLPSIGFRCCYTGNYFDP
jgi:hypothetical protein